MVDKQHVIEREFDGVFEFRLNRPEKLNAITPAMFEALGDAVARFAANPDLRVMLISSTGPYFTSGLQVTADISPAEGSSTLEGRAWYRNTYHRLFDEIEAVEKPIVAAHQGHCFGGGLELSLSCDFRLAARSATYRLPEIDIGALPGSGGVSRLTRVAGPHWARWLVMAGESVTADEAVNMGFVHRVHEDAEFAAAAEAFCRKLARQPYEMLGLAKLSIELAKDLDRAQGRNVERIANSMLFTGAEHKRMVQAFLDKQAQKRQQRNNDQGG
ncbi:enoyl-CoA hydratase/isomerase family protein (plasmid) [Diaphorobacter sp. HDW4B]|uniref:enoyl-CoA hydratase/isomerase family protein n=1 Tax=Diaphorobacter sp. HDW4B TaxID=2714925 RepID=UPI00140A19CE|nr:enoyl-CoA hydratase/isomerase family protein [Diaphorobacter sp. HDW4B]QIL74012.1 enoyl-CoA hydratase/isomerase family protein [Diaphorobacter sp. HDW4B]